MSLAIALLACALLIPTGVRVSERWPELDRHDLRGQGRGRGCGSGRGGGARIDEAVSVVARVRAGLRDRLRGGSTQPDPMRLLDAASACDLLAACLRAGMPPGDAVTATASAASPRFAGPLHDVSVRIALGAASPWALLEGVPELSDLVAPARRSGDSGAAMSAAVAELAVAHRAAAGDAAEATAQRAGVLIAGPLALCFLPAFVVLGLIPTIAGLAGSMLGSLTAGQP